MKRFRATTKAKKRGLTREQASTYQGAFEAVLAVPIAIGFGYWADQFFGSSPAGLLVGAVIGFAALVLRLVRMRPSGEAESSEAEVPTSSNDPGRKSGEKFEEE